MTRFINIVGQRYGKLTVLKVSEQRLRGLMSWDCICDCGNSKTVASQDLRAGHVNSCGCNQYKGVKKDITGQRNGSLTAVSRTDTKTTNGDYIWNFVCDCGRTRQLSLGAFSSKKNLMCKECTAKRLSKERSTHGFKQTHKTYKAWCKIKERCYNKNSPDYTLYGAKGISMSASFREDFLAFYAEIGEAPSKDHSVDRIDHTKGYIEGNLRWANDAQQARNKGKMKNNTSGVTGVLWDLKVFPSGRDSTTYAIAIWNSYDQDGKLTVHRKAFSVKKYGLLPAFKMACEHRKKMIQELNALGYGYADNHGM